MKILYFIRVWVKEILTKDTFGIRDRLRVEISVCCPVSFVRFHSNDLLDKVQFSKSRIIFVPFSIKVRDHEGYRIVFCN